LCNKNGTLLYNLSFYNLFQLFPSYNFFPYTTFSLTQLAQLQLLLISHIIENVIISCFPFLREVYFEDLLYVIYVTRTNIRDSFFYSTFFSCLVGLLNFFSTLVFLQSLLNFTWLVFFYLILLGWFFFYLILLEFLLELFGGNSFKLIFF